MKLFIQMMVLFSLTIGGARLVQAQTRLPQDGVIDVLDCADSNSDFKRFHGLQDYSPYAPGSGFFNLREATINYNYVSARLICEYSGSNAASTMQYGCVGYAFGVAASEYLMQVKITIDRAAKKVLVESKGSMLRPNESSWSCSYRGR